MSARELAHRIHANPATIQRRLETLEDLGYLELQHHGTDPPRAWLTITGYDLLEATETALLAAHAG